jgi:hypothetical protein
MISKTKRKLLINTISISIVAAVVSFIIINQFSFIIISVIDLDSLNILDAAVVYSYLNLFVVFAACILIIPAANSKQSRFIETQLILTIISFIASILLTSLIAWGYITIKNFDLLQNTSIFIKLTKLFVFPALLALIIEDFQPVFLISITIFILIYNISNYLSIKSSREY